MGRRILVVEDDRASREGLAQLLRSHGHEVLSAWSAEEATAVMDAFRPEVALLDVRLPGMPGDAFARYLRRISPDIRIVFVSAEHQVDIEHYEPAALVVSKPIDLPMLLSCIG